MTEPGGSQTAPHRPHYCAEHPTCELVRHKRAPGYRYWRSGWDPAVVCPMPEHADGQRERCAWCGGPLREDGASPWAQSARLTYCSATHRTYAWRSKKPAGYVNAAKRRHNARVAAGLARHYRPRQKPRAVAAP